VKTQAGSRPRTSVTANGGQVFGRSITKFSLITGADGGSGGPLHCDDLPPYVTRNNRNSSRRSPGRVFFIRPWSLVPILLKLEFTLAVKKVFLPCPQRASPQPFSSENDKNDARPGNGWLRSAVALDPGPVGGPSKPLWQIAT